MPILCQYSPKCDILNRNPSWSREYKLRVRELCDTQDCTKCPAYIRLEEQKETTAHTPENLRNFEEHLRSVLESPGSPESSAKLDCSGELEDWLDGSD